MENVSELEIHYYVLKLSCRFICMSEFGFDLKKCKIIDCRCDLDANVCVINQLDSLLRFYLIRYALKNQSIK